jgi:hypothetical protein
MTTGQRVRRQDHRVGGLCLCTSRRQWKVSASAGTSYRVPTLYQRFSSLRHLPTSSPSPAATPKSALKYSRRHQRSSVSRSSTATSLTNLLTFLSRATAPASTGACRRCPSNRACYSNTAKAQYDRASPSLLRKNSAMYRLSTDRWTCRTRKNRHPGPTAPCSAARASHGTWWASTCQVGGWQLGDRRAVVMASHAFDTAATSNVVLPGYSDSSISALRRHSRKDWKLVAKLDNLTDKAYQTAGTYATARRNLYVGVTWAPRFTFIQALQVHRAFPLSRHSCRCPGFRPGQDDGDECIGTASCKAGPRVRAVQMRAGFSGPLLARPGLWCAGTPARLVDDRRGRLQSSACTPRLKTPTSSLLKVSWASSTASPVRPTWRNALACRSLR